MKNAFVAGVVALLLIAIGLAAPLYFTPEPALAQSSAAADDAISSSSTSASATVKLQLTIGSFPEDAVGGSSVELYLEDDYQVPDDIDPGNIYFIATNLRSYATGNGSRVYATDAVEIDYDDHFGGDDDWSIQVFIPDMNTGDDFDGYQGPAEWQTVTMVVTKAAGIKNPSEEGSHSIGYSVLGPTDDNNDGPQVRLDDTRTLAKISLSDEDNSRGYELTVTGSGFNNGTSAAAHVLHNARFAVAQWWETLDCAGMKVAMGFEAGDTSDEAQAFCFHYGLNSTFQTYTVAEENLEASDAVFARHLCRIIIVEGHRAGLATVGSDDKVAVTFEVSVPIFGPGDQNYICMIDGEGRTSSTDVEQFELEPSIRVVPDEAAVGETVTVYAQDFPNTGAQFVELKLAGQIFQASGHSIGSDGSATATFRVPSEVNGLPLTGTVRVDAKWGSVSEDTKLTVVESTASRTAPSRLAAPSNLTAVPGNQRGTVNLSWNAPAGVQYHFVAWIPSGITDLNQAVIMPVSAEGRATISGLNAGTTYHFAVIAGRWEWAPNFGAKWSAWSNWADASIQ